MNQQEKQSKLGFFYRLLLACFKFFDRKGGLIEDYYLYKNSRKHQVKILRSLSRITTGLDYFGDFLKREFFQNIHNEFHHSLKKSKKLNLTLLDDARLWNLYAFASAACKSGKVLEFGTYKGGGVLFLSDILKDRKCKLYAFDTFIGHSSVDSAKDANQYLGDFDVSKFPDTRSRLWANEITCVEGDVVNTISEFESFQDVDFIHLDLDLYLPTKLVLENLDRLLRIGGICVVDDFGNQNCPGIADAVLDFQNSDSSGNYLFITPLSAQVVIIRIK
jgi:predicted O-methyltransferase YrrM